MASGVKEQMKGLSEGLVELISEKEFEERLQESIDKNRPLRIKYGADPSAPDLHLGHTVPLRKLRQFQEFGHTIVFIIGDFTAMIGDPTERTETRRMLTREEVDHNAKTYQDQVFKILDRSKTEVRYNSEWLGKMTTADFIHLTAQYTVARILERDDFQKRYAAKQPISIVEFLYPLLQGYDSVIIKSDVELGGTDQKFNLLVGRELQKSWKQKPQIVMTLPLIEGTDGVQKMSKSFNNHIAIHDTPREMFGKVMSIPDTMIERYFLYLSGLPSGEVAGLAKDLRSGTLHPREAKAKLAEQIVALYYSPDEGGKARAEFDQIFKDKGLPDEIPTVVLSRQKMDVVSLLKEADLVTSKGEGRRLVEQGGVKIDQKKVSDPALEVDLGRPVLVQCGKRKFAKVQYGGNG
ncbi:MAG: tyrosine--tRNA ligase [Candidatus Omnitrophica bacterium]|nr:tyrosine--tRNA ligase [Candidatus Omnitrophota bacterium]MDD5672452.1 tyrosine--tRNA ligase [Candidatus Omnitrophota bacterium]